MHVVANGVQMLTCEKARKQMGAPFQIQAELCMSKTGRLSHMFT